MRRLPWLELAMRFYPSSWRERYREEVLDLASELTEEGPPSELTVALGVVLNAPRIWSRRVTAVLRPLVLTGVAAVISVGALVSVILYPAGPAASSATTVPFTMASGAMRPTLKVNEIIQVKLFRSPAKIEAGEIVVFRPPRVFDCAGSNPVYVVKRVVGLPGQTVSLSSGHVLIDGRKLKEQWLPASEQGATYPGPSAQAYALHASYRITANDFYVLGDNRTDSCDSRYWGPVSRDLLYGEVVGGN